MMVLQQESSSITGKLFGSIKLLLDATRQFSESNFSWFPMLSTITIAVRFSIYRQWYTNYSSQQTMSTSTSKSSVQTDIISSFKRRNIPIPCEMSLKWSKSQYQQILIGDTTSCSFSMLSTSKMAVRFDCGDVTNVEPSAGHFRCALCSGDVVFSQIIVHCRYMLHWLTTKIVIKYFKYKLVDVTISTYKSLS